MKYMMRFGSLLLALALEVRAGELGVKVAGFACLCIEVNCCGDVLLVEECCCLYRRQSPHSRSSAMALVPAHHETRVIAVEVTDSEPSSATLDDARSSGDRHDV